MAIDDLLDEHEQSERVRGWLRNNGAGLIGGVALGLAVILGWQWWQKDQARKNEQAHLDYQAALEGATGNDLKKAQAAVAKLSTEDEVYADLAGLQLAKAQVQAGERDAAIATLRGLTPDASLKPVVDLRLARLLNDAGKHAEALALLAKSDDPSSLEARGDALLATGKAKEAQDAYTKALATLDVASPQRRLIEIKLVSAGGTLPKTGGTA
ncbi:tetratricopeptide repeat protein [Pseudoxanthomonas sp. SL93]|jgi:predicted negative regulator of RcsB-dependent stress response|uniref:YfgM family protein n=1 Tax=Pseudoxanthomonas sp. SL93 TaxID=2995142 RepID=UPI0022722928|nr:tetratricopeptide repeat protein [Pseudoxanthomonas sp. SL93]WAC63946.1 tetratricopeptide repeat protein [Pseudoxanthomonas sp. SL93]